MPNGGYAMSATGEKEKHSNASSSGPHKEVRLRMLSKGRFNNLIRLVNEYDREVRRCTKARAYYAANALLGAQLEGMLLGMCDLFPEEVRKWFADLPSGQRPKNAIEKWDLATLSRVARDLKWLPARSKPRGHYKIGDWVDLVREMRNLVHPGRHLRDYPKLRIRNTHLSNAKDVFNAANSWLMAKIGDDLERAIKREESRKRKQDTRPSRR
jgi:hypothetical protein